MEVFGVHPSETAARIAEAIDMILRLWSGELPVDLHGRFWNVAMKDHLHLGFGVGHLHRPFQQPHPPIHVPSIRRSSVGLMKAAERGFRFISHHMNHPDALREQWTTYSRAATEAGRATGPADWSVARNVFVADSTDEARRLARSNSLGSCIQYILDLTRATATDGVAMWKRDEGQADSDCTLDYFLDEVVIAGDPGDVTAELLELRDRIGPFGTLVLTAHDWDDRDRWIRHLELFAREVIPAFNRAIGAESGP
jgi:alkanesulfonate monooxygenase SsuD/methylene tetrahydromethanopterin reductase-like flavin-dependent oxidoreductase (luciferase family)